MVLFLSILLLCYLVFMVGMTIGWNTLSPGRTSGHDLNLSVVVAVRNEEKNIKNLLSDLFDQTLSKKNYEVIIVDDHSEDETVPRVEEFIKPHAEMHLRV